MLTIGMINRRDFLKLSAATGVLSLTGQNAFLANAIANNAGYNQNFTVIFSGLQQNYVSDMKKGRQEYISNCNKVMEMCKKKDIPTIFVNTPNGGDMEQKIYRFSIQIPRHTYVPIRTMNDVILRVFPEPITDDEWARQTKEEELLSQSLEFITGIFDEPLSGIDNHNILLVGRHLNKLENKLLYKGYNVITSQDLSGGDPNDFPSDFHKIKDILDMMKKHEPVITPPTIDLAPEDLIWGFMITDMQDAFLEPTLINPQFVSRMLKAQNEVIGWCNKYKRPILVFEKDPARYGVTTSRLNLKGAKKIEYYERADGNNGFCQDALDFCNREGVQGLISSGVYTRACQRGTGYGAKRMGINHIISVDNLTEHHHMDSIFRKDTFSPIGGFHANSHDEVKRLLKG